jgi:DNA-binding response OmpR family regulator
MKILVADDDPVCKRFLTGVLHRAGHRVIETSDGSELWDAYQTEPTNLVVTDWMMPRETGIEVCRKIREQPRDAYTYIIVVTSLSDGEHTLQGFRAGADEMVAKPFDAATLMQRVETGARLVQRMVAQAEHGLRRSLDVLQGALGPEDGRLLENVTELTDLYRGQRAFVKCRAFLRRQISIIESAYGPDDYRLRKLRDELSQLRNADDAAY